MSRNRIHIYDVIVGNIGQVYHGCEWKDAMEDFLFYKNRSIEGIGRGANEPVTLMRDGEIEQEYQPSQSTDQ